MSLLNANVGTHIPVFESFAVTQSHMKDFPCLAVLEAWSFVLRLPASNEDSCRSSSTEKSKPHQNLDVASLS